MRECRFRQYSKGMGGILADDMVSLSSALLSCLPY